MAFWEEGDVVKVVKISKSDANIFYNKFEHLGNCGLGVWHYGLIVNHTLLSVVSYGTTCFNQNRGFLSEVLKNHSVKLFQLARGGTKLNCPRNIPSQIIKYSMLEIRKDFGNTIIVAYSDETYNEIGTIYQASNFHYTGLTNPKGQSNYYINDNYLSGWTVRKKYGTRNVEKLAQMGLKIYKVPLKPKHRYLYINSSPIIKKSITRELSKMFVDYPKREGYSVDSLTVMK